MDKTLNESTSTAVVNITEMATEHVQNQPKIEDHVKDSLTISSGSNTAPDSNESGVTSPEVPLEPPTDPLDDLFKDPPVVDNKGNPFNPDEHDKRQIINKDGTWRKKGGFHAHKPKEQPQPTPTINEPPEPQPEPQSDQTPQGQPFSHDDCMNSATMVVDSLLAVGGMVGGPEWAPMKTTVKVNGQQLTVDERANLIDAFYKYFKATGNIDIPPGLNLSLVLALYAVPRFQQPITRDKWTRFKDWVKLKVLKRRMKNGSSTPRDDSGSE